MAIFNLGSVLVGITLFIYFRVKTVHKDFMNILSGMVFVFPPSLQSKQLQYIPGTTEKIGHLPEYSAYENIVMLLFCIPVISLLYFGSTLYDQRVTDDIFKVFGFVVLCAAGYFLWKGVSIVLGFKHRFYYLKYGWFVGSIFALILYILDSNFGLIEELIKQTSTSNQYAIANASFFFGFNLPQETLVRAFRWTVLAVVVQLIAFNFMALSNAFYAFRIMNRHLMYTKSDNPGVIEILGRYRVVQKALNFQIVLSAITFGAAIYYNEWHCFLILGGLIATLALRTLRVHDELNVILSKNSEAVFRLNAQMAQFTDDKKLPGEIKEKFIALSKTSNSLFNKSIKITIAQINPLTALVTLASCLTLLAFFSGSGTGFIVNYSDKRLDLNALPTLTALSMARRDTCFPAESQARQIILSQLSNASPNFWYAEMFKTIFTAYKGFILEVISAISACWILYEGAAIFVLLVFLKKIRY